MGRERLSICYAVPGHNLLSSAGPTRNVLYLAEALSQWADVTVAFRRVVEPTVPQGYKVVALEPSAHEAHCQVDDAAVRGSSLAEFLTYLRSIRQFVNEQLFAYDIVLEKSWLLSGYLTALCQRRDFPAAVVENIVRVWQESLRSPHGLLRYGQHGLVQAVVGRYLRQAPLIIAETEELKASLQQRWRIPTRRIEVVGLGVNHRLFRPLDQAKARQALGISPHATVLLYAGILDRAHHLAPVIEAMCEVSNPSLELHIVGDGVLRGFYDSKARTSQAPVVFHGRLPHEMVPQYIAAADLCIAPYDTAAFPNGQVAYSTLKIPEYMAVGRPVVSVPSGHILRLLTHNVTGFLFPNDVCNWVKFLRHCPSRERLQGMRAAALRAAAAYSWDDTARAYLRLCARMVGKRNGDHSTFLLSDPT